MSTAAPAAYPAEEDSHPKTGVSGRVLSYAGGPEDKEQKGDSTFTPAAVLGSNWALALRFLTPTEDFATVSFGWSQGCLGGCTPCLCLLACSALTSSSSKNTEAH